MLKQNTEDRKYDQGYTTRKWDLAYTIRMHFCLSEIRERGISQRMA